MYAEFFGMDRLPFAITPNTDFFYCDSSHQEALNVLLVALQNGEGFLKITGEVGTGKTLLCHMLLKELDDQFFQTIYIPNPFLKPSMLRHAIAKELGLRLTSLKDDNILVEVINEKLISLAKQGKKVILCMDEAQALPTKSLEALRLFSNLETKTQKLLQIVLFAQPELDQKLQKKHLRQLQQRITFSHKIKPIKKQEMESYIRYRLTIAGYNYRTLFDKQCIALIARYSQGIPRLINILCHKSLMVAYGKGDRQVRKNYILQAVEDTEGLNLSFWHKSFPFIWRVG